MLLVWKRLRIIIWLLTGLTIPDEGHRDPRTLRLQFLTIANMTQHSNDMSLTLTKARFHSHTFFIKKLTVLFTALTLLDLEQFPWQ